MFPLFRAIEEKWGPVVKMDENFNKLECTKEKPLPKLHGMNILGVMHNIKGMRLQLAGRCEIGFRGKNASYATFIIR